ncbi:MAG TPA: protein kinase [Polyangia bacterium]|nr:protein kinase [Polyangia bacterium]
MSAIVGIDRSSTGALPGGNGFYRVGELVAGRYLVRELIGTGPLGMVYRTENRHSGGLVALRVLWPDLLVDDASRARFLKESIRARTVQNRYVAPLYEAFIDEAGGQVVCVLAVKHLGGPTLASRVARRLEHGVPLLALEAQPIVSQIGVGLSAIHRVGLVHGNLRATSVYFAGDEIRIADLGVASALPAEIVALAEAHAGKGGGRAPEVAEGRRSSPASDVYAFAVLTAQMLGLMSPSSRDDVPVPRSVRVVLRRALSQNPRDRYADVDTFAGALVTAFERADQASVLGLRAVAPLGEATPKVQRFRPERSAVVTGALEARPPAPGARPTPARAAAASVVVDPKAMSLYSETPATLPPLVRSDGRSEGRSDVRQPPIPLRHLRRSGPPHPVPHPPPGPRRSPPHAPPAPPTRQSTPVSTPPSPVPATGIRTGRPGVRIAPRVPLALVLALTLAATGLGAAVVRNVVVGRFEVRLAEERIAKAELLRQAAPAPDPNLPPGSE